MRRITGTYPLLLGGLVLALLAVQGPGRTLAQEQPAPTPKPSALIVPISGTIKLQMSKKQTIRQVTNPKENAVSIRTVVGDPTTILVIGQQPDVTRLELEDTEGNKETYEVIVQADIEYLRTQLKRAIPSANVTPIPTSNNTVILSGTVTRAEDVAVIRGLVQSVGFKYIDAMRVGGVQQVQLDVIIVQVSRTDLRNLTFNFLGSSKWGAGGSTIGNAITTGGGGGSGGVFPATAGAGAALVGSPTAATNLLLGFVHNAWGFQNFLEALRKNGLAKLLAQPRLVTLSGRPAYFNVGGQQAVPQTGSFGGTGVTFYPFGTQLSFNPIVLGNGKIYLEIAPSISNLDAAAGVTLAGSSNVPGRTITYVNTSVELEAGQTFVLGGLIQHEVQATSSKVPCLGDLPYFGTFFRSMQYQDTEQEVLVIVTPWLVDGMSCDQRAKVLPGEETRKPDDFELFLEGVLEAPRGPRKAFQNHHYVAPWKSSPSAATFPCADRHNCGVGGCGVGGCAGGTCGLPGAGDAVNTAAPMQPPSALMSGPAPFTSPAPMPTPGTPAPLGAMPETRLQAAPSGGEEGSSPPVMNEQPPSAPLPGAR